MGSPYLKSGEDIVLTTHRISVDAVPYDIMLTTERLFLIDEQSARFEPRILPLNMLLSVRGGMTPAQDPVIILLFRTPEGIGEKQPVNLVFSQTKNENRIPERDDWVRNLIQLNISHEERESPAEAPPVPEVAGVIGLRPTARHGVAPEKVRPLSNVSSRLTVPPPVTVIPDEIESSRTIPVPAPEVREPVGRKITATDTSVAEQSISLTPIRGTPPAIAPAPARVIIPQIIEELRPVRKPAILTDKQEPVPASGYDDEALFRTIPTASRSMTVTEERTSQQSEPPEAPPVPEPALHITNVPVPEKVPVPEEGIPAPGIEELKEVPEIIRALHTGATEPAADEEPVPEPEPEIIRALYTGATEPAATEPAVDEGPVLEPVPEIAPAGIRGIPESHVTLTIPENVVQESISHHEPETVFQRETLAAQPPPVRHPIPPAREIRPIRTTLIYAAVLLLVIALVAAGAVLLFAQGPAQTGSPVTPTPGIVQVTPSPPETVRPATMPPAATRVTAPVPSRPAPSIPLTGVWVRVNSSALYFGNVGNTGQMQKVTGTGDNFYQVLRSDRPVQVSVQKNDNSGAVLAVSIYRNGTLISSGSVTSPMGTVDMLIDPLTGRPPGLVTSGTFVTPTATFHLENY